MKTSAFLIASKWYNAYILLVIFPIMNNKKENINVLVSFIIVLCVVGFVVYAITNRTKNASTTESLNNQMNETVNEGTQTEKDKDMDRVSKVGDVLVMNYTGRFTNGEAFDSNVLPEFGHVTPFKFTLGAGQVIKGWDEGLVGMKIGEKKTLTIPPEKGYGSQPVGPIPANSTLIFEVELVDIQ